MNDPLFSRLPLPSALLENLERLEYLRMTPVQAQTLPLLLEGGDAVVRARTGTGKTAAFGIAALCRLDPGRSDVQSLVLCPTRELAEQVTRELRRLGRFIPNLKVLTLCGGSPLRPQQASLRHGAHIAVGTPGRLLQLLETGSLDLFALRSLVIDEADRMLDMGFSEAIEAVVAFAPTRRQTLLFSATFPEGMEGLTALLQEDAAIVKTEEATEKIAIGETFYDVEAEEKHGALLRLLGRYRPERAIVFTNTKVGADLLARELRASGVGALALHGDLEQYERTDVLVRFSNRSAPLLVATDVAARGLDIEGLDAVVNYDLPRTPAVYTHRIGRTGRAGASGSAWTLYTPEERAEAETYRDGSRRFEPAPDWELPESLPEAPNVTIVLEGGRKQKLRPGDLLGALSGEGGIPGPAVGRIDIYERQSYVAVEKKYGDDAYERLKSKGVKGRRFPLWLLE